MGLFNSITNQFSVLFKKSKLKAEPEKVDINIDSLPEWLYKITLNDPNELRQKTNNYLERLKSIATDLETAVNQLKLIDIYDVTVSHYKKELIRGKKNTLVNRTASIKDGILSIGDETMETKRRMLEKLDTEAKELATRFGQFEKPLKEFFEKDVAALKTTFTSLVKELDGFEQMFKGENDEKVNKAIKMIETIQDHINSEKHFNADISNERTEFDQNKANIFKLRDKLHSLKKNARFRDILNERDDLRQLEDAKNRKLDLALKKYDLLYAHIDKNDLTKEYAQYFEDALIDDDNLSLLGFILKIEGHDETKEWFSSNLKAIQDELVDTNSRIKSSWKLLKKHAIINEIEDVERRMQYFQNRANEIKTVIAEKREDISDLKIEELKQKLYKELIVLTGYEVNVIYTEPIEEILA